MQRRLHVGSQKRPHEALYVSGSRNLCPAGWHVPSQAEWNTLSTYLGGYNISGSQVMETGTEHWKTGSGSNSSGFTALPGGTRDNYIPDWDFKFIGDRASFWTSSPSLFNIETRAYSYTVYSENGAGMSGSTHNKTAGNSVRCLKD